jgi:hypothetical protein
MLGAWGYAPKFAQSATLPCAKLYFALSNATAPEPIQEFLISIREFLSSVRGQVNIYKHRETGTYVIFVPEAVADRKVQGVFKNTIKEIDDAIQAKGLNSLTMENQSINVHYSTLTHLACKVACAATFVGSTVSAAGMVVGMIGILPKPAPGAGEVFVGATASAFAFTIAKEYLSNKAEQMERAKSSPLDNASVIAEVEDAINSRLVTANASSNSKAVVIVTVPNDKSLPHSSDLKLYFQNRFDTYGVIDEFQKEFGNFRK